MPARRQNAESRNAFFGARPFVRFHCGTFAGYLLRVPLDYDMQHRLLAFEQPIRKNQEITAGLGEDCLSKLSIATSYPIDSVACLIVEL